MSEEQVVVEPVVEPVVAPIVAPIAEPVVPAKSISMMDEEGKFTKEFRDSLPDGIGAHSDFEKYKTVPEFVKASVNKTALLGKKLEEVIASDDPAVSDLKAKILGVPKDLTGYTYDTPEDFAKLPEEVQSVVKEGYEKAKEVAKSANLSASQFKAMVEFDMSRALEMRKEAEAFMENKAGEEEKALMKQYPGDSYQRHVDKTIKTLEALGLQDLMNLSEIKNSPKLFAQIGEQLSQIIDDDKLVESRVQEESKTNLEHYEEAMEAMRRYKGNQSDPEYKKLMDKASHYLKKLK